MPFGAVGKGEYGTYFIGYARSPTPTEQMLLNMFVGRPEGNYDRLLDVSRAVTGNLFFVPLVPLVESLADDEAADAAAPADAPADGSDEPGPASSATAGVRTNATQPGRPAHGASLKSGGSLNIGNLRGESHDG